MARAWTKRQHEKLSKQQEANKRQIEFLSELPYVTETDEAGEYFAD